MADSPYSVTEQRLQVRLVEAKGKVPIVWPSVLETREYHYERIAEDPQCSQQVILKSDRYGAPLLQVALAYPRRPEPSVNHWPDTLPDTLPEDCRDEQQQTLHLSLTQSRWHHQVQAKSDVRLLALPNATATEIFSLASTDVPTDGFNSESLIALLANRQPTAFGGQQQIWYLDKNDKPTATAPALPPRVAFTEKAVLDESVISALPDIVTPKLLVSAGYQQAPMLFPRKGIPDESVWVSRSGYARYADARGFHRPIAHHNTLLTGETTLTWDVHCIVIISTRDAAGLITSADYDWRFLAPCRLIYVNHNQHHAAFDALGRVIMTWFHGTENAAEVGFSGPKEMLVPTEATSALALRSLPVAQCLVYVPGSWMSELDASLAMQNVPQTEDGYLSAMMRRHLTPRQLSTLPLSHREPPHIVTLTADRFDGDLRQQVRQQVVLSDGFGRALQTAIRHEAGKAWLRTDDGSLKTNASGAPAMAHTSFRWAVSGRTEYDNKGQSVKTWLPYFLNDWRHVNNDSARQDLWADTNWYDPLGRVVRVCTAAGFERRTLLTPWFTVAEDENDTLA